MNSAALERVLKCPNLPSLPGVAIEVLELTRDRNVPLRRIAEVVQNDQALAVKILKTVNSSFYGLVKPCPTISRAMAYLGIETVKSLVLGFSLVDMVGQQASADFDYVGFWRRSIYGATGARFFAGMTGASDAEEAFIAALVQDLGMLAMRTALGGVYAEAIRPCGRNHEGVCEAERAAFGFDHQVAGAALAEKWRLPPQMVESIRRHHRPGGGGPCAHEEIVRLVILANLATRAMDEQGRGSALTNYIDQAREWFDVRSEVAVQTLKSISDRSRELSRLFHLDTGPKVEIYELLTTANELLTEHQLAVGKQSRLLQERNDDLRRRSTTDPLTGAANRASFDESIDSCFAAALDEETSLGLLFIDLDHFKSINDTIGHQAGDAVLIELVHRTSQLLGDAGVIARYGGEEFAVILPGYDLRSAAELAEKIRTAIAASPFPLRREVDLVDSVPVTASIGVASFDRESRDVLADATRLIQAADKAVYAAKHAGRNRVRVFAVKPASSTHAVDRSPVGLPGHLVGAVPIEAERRLASVYATVGVAATERITAPESSAHAVLLVEDDPLVVALFRNAIEQEAGFRLLVAANGEEAIDLLREGAVNVDIIVCDLHLPGVSGSEFARQARAMQVRRAPLVVISADESAEAAEQAMAAGADAFLPKSRIGDDPSRRILDLCRRWCVSRKVA